jgi:glycosyltransferase involved in cell wall biosynthesis
MVLDERGQSSVEPLVAFYIENFNCGGIQKIVSILAKELQRRGRKVEVVVCDASGSLAEAFAGLPVVELAPSNRLRVRLAALQSDPLGFRRLLLPVLLANPPSETLQFVPGLTQYIRAHRPSALFSGGTYMNIECLFAKRLASSQVRLVMSERTHFSVAKLSSLKRHNVQWRRRFIAPLVRWAYPQADAIVAVSHGVARDLAHVTKAHTIRVIHNPTITPDFEARLSAPLEHRWMNHKSVPVILSVGRLAPQKGLPILLRAFALVTREQSARLVIIGGPTDSDKLDRQKGKLLALAESLGVVGDVDFLGYLANPLPYMRQCDLFVLSSLFEGFPNVLVEALAAGCRIVSTDCPSGPAEILRGGDFGTLVAVGDVESLARAMREALRRKHDLTRQKEWAKSFAFNEAIAAYDRVLLGLEAQVSPAVSGGGCIPDEAYSSVGS